MSKYSVGLDVSAKEIHCCISFIDAVQSVTVKATRKIPNTAKGFRELDTWMSRHHKQKDSPLVVCMEATGVYFGELCTVSSQSRLLCISDSTQQGQKVSSGIRTEIQE